MAQPSGWISVKQRTCGPVFVYRFFQLVNGLLVEKSKTLGLVSELRSNKKAWEKAEQEGYLALANTLTSSSTFGQLASQYIESGAINYKKGFLELKAKESIKRDEANLRLYAVPKWGDTPAIKISVDDLTTWYLELNHSLAWGSISKVHDVMSLVYQWALRKGTLPADPAYNPFRPSKMGGVTCKDSSSYEARIAEPEQVIAILQELDTPETKMAWTLVLLHACTALRPSEGFGLKWADLDCKHNQINLRRAFSKGHQTAGKTKMSMTQVAMHPTLAFYLEEWRNQSCYSKDEDWIFASPTMNGKRPLNANTSGKRYLRPAAIKAGVIADDENIRFGWMNLRHSLATFLADKVGLKATQSALRHSKIRTSAEV